ncbi:MAG TPA: M20 family metallopeptidase [Candidatus Binataceae bacterium]|nr:M20 family metallopeptidase [Candidatus Binataceae bacterium]
MDAKQGVHEQLEASRKSLIDLSHRIHANPELGWEEEKASMWVAEALSDAGFKVERKVCDLPTAVRARAGSGPLHIGFCAEYDSLPSIGHACGHNVIAALGVGAAIALAKVADDVGLTITLLGTPAEEIHPSGKIVMLERGAFDGLHAAMMVHPAPWDQVAPPIIAASMFDVIYRGKESHASAFPERGINAADALTVAQTSIALLRQHIRSTDRIHGIVTKGGAAPNIVPAYTSAKYMARSSTLAQLKDLLPRVNRCFEAGALATGCKLEIVGGDKPVAEMVTDRELAALYTRNAEGLGRKFDETQTAAGSTDMGNVSLALPSIHPFVGINSLPAVNHQPEFTAHCVREEADRALFEGALAMAWTAIDAAQDSALRSRLMASELNPGS